MGRSLLFKLTLFAVVLASVVVVLGAFTRLVHAGLGCPDWPGCYGHLTWPDSAHEIALAEAKFPESPVDLEKTWPEMVHRYFAGTLGLLVLALLIICLRASRKEKGLPVKLAVGISFLIILQAAFGMWTVTLKLWPQVVTAHLLGGFAMLSLLWLFAQRIGPWCWTLNQALQDALPKLKRFALFAMVLLTLQIALGGWVSSNYAAVACPDLPTCHGVWFPQADFAQGFNIFQHVGPNYLGGLLDNEARTAIHLSHRIGAIVVSITLVILSIMLWQTGAPVARRLSVILSSVLLVQVTLGLSNIYWVLPLPVAVAHNAVGALLLLVMVTLNHRLHSARIEQN